MTAGRGAAVSRLPTAWSRPRPSCRWARSARSRASGRSSSPTAGASIMLANLYHLAVRPGIDVIERARRSACASPAGMARSSPTAAASRSSAWRACAGSTRRRSPSAATSTAPLCASRPRTWCSAAGAHRRRSRDGARRVPALARRAPRSEAASARTARWAERSLAARRDDRGGPLRHRAGGRHRDLRERRRGANRRRWASTAMPSAVSSVGEPAAERRAVVEWTAPALPEERPRYLMGVGTLADLLHAVEQGVDLFDCVLPSRNARHGVLFTRDGVLRIKNAAFRDDPRPLDPECGCPACRASVARLPAPSGARRRAHRRGPRDAAQPARLP